jgi:hypothetical protein
MSISDEKAYEEVGRAWRHFASWREKIFAGYLSLLAALAWGFPKTNGTPIHVAILACAILVSAVFWMLDFRNIQLLNACQLAGEHLETSEGFYTRLNQLRFEQSSPLGYGLAISLLVVSVVGASVGGISFYVLGRLLNNFSLCWSFVIGVTIAGALYAGLRKLSHKRQSIERAIWKHREKAK